VRVQRPIADMSDARILEIERLAQARNLDFNASPGARSLRAALDAEIQARNLTVPGGPTPPSAGGATPPPVGGGTPPPDGGTPPPPASGGAPPLPPSGSGGPPGSGGGPPPPPTGSGPPSPPGAPATPPTPPTPPHIIPVSPNMNIGADTAGTGGITAISGFRAQDGSQQISIDGRVLPSLGDSRQGFETNLVHGDDIGLGHYHLAHLWGPGLGDEAAAGIWLAPRTINTSVQRRVETQLEGLARVANSQGGRLTLRVTGATHPSAEVPANLRAHDFLAEVKYQFTVEIPGTPPASGEVTIRIGAPPNGRLELLGAASLDRLTEVR
jgi:Bacterial toxin 4